MQSRLESAFGLVYASQQLSRQGGRNANLAIKDWEALTIDTLVGSLKRRLIAPLKSPPKAYEKAGVEDGERLCIAASPKYDIPFAFHHDACDA